MAVVAVRPPESVATHSAAEGAGPQAATAVIPAVHLASVRKIYGSGDSSLVALDGLTFDVAPGDFTCLVGASGCGKSTLLSIIAGLDAPTAGTVETRGRVALMFQEAALFPWLTARANVELALRLRGIPRRERRERADEMLERVHLQDFGDRRPHELSGGMRQRVALARALAQEAEVLLMDEPFGALDAMTRDLLHEELERLWSGSDMSILFVTHNVREAVRLGRRVLLLSSRPGRIVADYPVSIDGPRTIESRSVAELAMVIRERLGEEVRSHATD